jgi:uncharacterized membrane protein
MSDYVVARSLHVLGVVLWIGGVAMVTTVLLPAVRSLKAPQERLEFFERVESRFAAQARWTTLLTGASGFWIAWRLDLWARFSELRFWWMHAMVCVWALFTLMLFVLEPFVLRRRFLDRARADPVRAFALAQRLHWLLLIVSLVTVLAAAAGAHGAFA